MAKKQGFFNKLIMGADNMPDFTPSQLPTTRWGLFRDSASCNAYYDVSQFARIQYICSV